MKSRFSAVAAFRSAIQRGSGSIVQGIMHVIGGKSTNMLPTPASPC